MRVPLVTDYREIISHDVDGVVVATPNQLHEPIGSFFLEHDLPVLVEKPIADTVSGGVELCRRISCRGADPRRTPPSS
jgi:predicted dehydrogenase